MSIVNTHEPSSSAITPGRPLVSADAGRDTPNTPTLIIAPKPRTTVYARPVIDGDLNICSLVALAAF